MMASINRSAILLLGYLTSLILVNESSNSLKSEKASGFSTEHREDVISNETLPCEEYADCSHPRKVCSCGPSCELFKNCCNFKFRNVSWSYEQQSMVSNFKECVVLRDTAIWAIDKCPRSTSTLSTYHNKTKLFLILPVTDQFNITYSNAKIAECHGVSDYLTWRMAITDDVKRCSFGDTWTYINNFISGIMYNRTVTLSGLAQLFFENSCTVNYYPPEGRSSHYCQGKVTSSQDCSPLFRPIHNILHGGYIDNDIYQNIDCCKSLNRCKGGYHCIIRHSDIMNPFDDMRVDYLKGKSGMVLLDLNEKNTKTELAIKFLNMKFEREFTFDVSRRIGNNELLVTFCLLKQYFANNGFMIEQTSIKFYEVHNSLQVSRYIISNWLVLNPRRLLELNRAKQIQNWLDSMEVEIDSVTSQASNNTKYVTRRYFDTENISMSVIHKISPSRGRLSSFDKFLRTIALCRYLEEANASPGRWCYYLHVKVIMGGDGFHVQWTCKSWIDNTGEKEHRNTALSIFRSTLRNDVLVYAILTCIIQTTVTLT